MIEYHECDISEVSRQGKDGCVLLFSSELDKKMAYVRLEARIRNDDVADAKKEAAAVPDLLAACRESAEFFESTELATYEHHRDNGTLHLHSTDPLLIRLRAAIAKATTTGETRP